MALIHCQGFRTWINMTPNSKKKLMFLSFKWHSVDIVYVLPSQILLGKLDYIIPLNIFF